MKNKELKKLVRIKEKRTFVLNVLCECGGEFVVDVGDASDIFTSLFKSISDKTAHEFNHKCRKCGKTKTFHHTFPKEKYFEIGLDTTTDAIAEYVAKAFEEELDDVVGYETNIEA